MIGLSAAKRKATLLESRARACGQVDDFPASGRGSCFKVNTLQGGARGETLILIVAHQFPLNRPRRSQRPRGGGRCQALA